MSTHATHRAAPLRSAIVILADGAREDVVDRLLDLGQLPGIERLRSTGGALRMTTSVFPSTTGPAHIPIVCGHFPGPARIPGIRVFRSDRGESTLRPRPASHVSYCGVQANALDRDLGPSTLFERTERSAGIFPVIGRGLSAKRNLGSGRRSVLWPVAHFSGRFQRSDRQAADLLVANASDHRLLFALFPGIDGSTHRRSPADPRTLASYRLVDQAVDRVLDRLEAAGRRDDTLVCVCSDHGGSPVDRHLDLDRTLVETGLRVASFPFTPWRRRADAIVCVSGNSMASIHLADRLGAEALARQLLAQPEIDVVVRRDDDDAAAIISSSRGSARVEIAHERQELRWLPLSDAPPLDHSLPATCSWADALEISAESDYPDGYLQAAQVLGCPHAGDLIVAAAPGCDLRAHGEIPRHRAGHGALHRAHMATPFVSSHPLHEGPMRTIDIEATVSEWLGLAPAGVGTSRLA